MVDGQAKESTVHSTIVEKNCSNFKARWKKRRILLQVSMNIERHLLANLTQAIVSEEKGSTVSNTHQKKCMVQM